MICRFNTRLSEISENTFSQLSLLFSSYVPLPVVLCRWVREFLNEENKGLDVLVEYLSFAQYAVT